MEKYIGLSSESKPAGVKNGSLFIEVNTGFKYVYYNNQWYKQKETKIDTSDATATASDIIQGKTAYANGEKITGTYEGIIPEGTINITENGEINIAQYETANVNVSGGGVEEKDVNFYDYDGTLIDAYTKSEFLGLSAMPENPTHTGLVAQGWNWTLEDAQNYVTNFNTLSIGQIYTTSSGLSEFDIELTPVTGLTVTLNMNGTKNWGDNTSDDTITHTYATAGKYTITCDGTTMSVSQNSGLFGQGSTIAYKNSYVTNVHIANCTNIAGYCLDNCAELENITISNDATYIGSGAFKGCLALKYIVVPKTVTNIDFPGVFSECFILEKIIFHNMSQAIYHNWFQSDFSLKEINIPAGVTAITQNAFASCYSIKKIVFPAGLTSIGNYAFQYCYNMQVYDFSKCNSVPTLGITAFDGINGLTKIVVPDSLYTTWIEASRWVNYANYIVKSSDYFGG